MLCFVGCQECFDSFVIEYTVYPLWSRLLSTTRGGSCHTSFHFKSKRQKCPGSHQASQTFKEKRRNPPPFHKSSSRSELSISARIVVAFSSDLLKGSLPFPSRTRDVCSPFLLWWSGMSLDSSPNLGEGSFLTVLYNSTIRVKGKWQPMRECQICYSSALNWKSLFSLLSTALLLDPAVTALKILCQPLQYRLGSWQWFTHWFMSPMYPSRVLALLHCNLV